jgi:3-oxoacyl-[acyl-carrier protein] reductase
MSNPSYVIVGASGGIGSEVCRRVAGPGVRLVLAARDTARLEALASELGTECVVEPCDATNSARVDNVFTRAAAAGPVLGAVNLCGSILLKTRSSPTRSRRT